MDQPTKLAATQLMDARVVIAATVRDAINQDGAVLLDIAQGLCLSLNLVGAKIWQMLKQDWTGEQIVCALEREFGDVSRAQLEQDYMDFLGQLESNKLAQLESARTTAKEAAA